MFSRQHVTLFMSEGKPLQQEQFCAVMHVACDTAIPWRGCNMCVLLCVLFDTKTRPDDPVICQTERCSGLLTSQAAVHERPWRPSVTLL